MPVILYKGTKISPRNAIYIQVNRTKALMEKIIFITYLIEFKRYPQPKITLCICNLCRSPEFSWLLTENQYDKKNRPNSQNIPENQMCKLLKETRRDINNMVCVYICFISSRMCCHLHKSKSCAFVVLKITQSIDVLLDLKKTNDCSDTYIQARLFPPKN